MKKIIGLLALSALTLMGCDYKSAHAQNPVSAEVGTPDSTNLLIIDQGEALIQGPSDPNADMKALPGNSGVDVEPVPATTPDMQPSMDNVTVDETITQEEDY